MEEMPVEPTGELDILELIGAPIDADELRRDIDVWHSSEPGSTSPWMPTDEASAEWAALKMASAERERHERLAVLDAYRRKVNAAMEWECEHGRVGQLARTINFMRDRLERWAMLRRLTGPVDKKGEPKLKTVMLPSARIETRKIQRRRAAWEVVDETALRDWVFDNFAADDELIVRSVNVKRLRDMILPHREDETKDSQRAVYVPSMVVVPGVVWHPAEEDVGATVRLIEIGEPELDQ